MIFQGNSRGHLKVRDILNEAGLNFEEEYSFDELKASSGRLLRFDFMVLDDAGDLDFAIEVNGEQHYEAVDVFGGKKSFSRQQFNDRQKRAFCRSRDIPMVEIPHWELELVDLDYIFNKAGI